MIDLQSGLYFKRLFVMLIPARIRVPILKNTELKDPRESLERSRPTDPEACRNYLYFHDI